jgi:hypothetical protein
MALKILFFIVLTSFLYCISIIADGKGFVKRFFEFHPNKIQFLSVLRAEAGNAGLCNRNEHWDNSYK